MIKKPKEYYNERKIQVLRLASVLKRGVEIIDLQHNLNIEYDNAKQLLYHYRKQELLNHPKRGLYKLSRRGQARLEYLQARIEISKTTGIDIGLNHHRRCPVPMYEIVSKYERLSGKTWPEAVML